MPQWMLVIMMGVIMTMTSDDGVRGGWEGKEMAYGS